MLSTRSARKVLAATALASAALAAPAVAVAAATHTSLANRAAALGRCKTDALTLSLSSGTSGGPGVTNYVLDLTYSGARACLMKGNPRILPVNSDGTQVGYRSKSVDQAGKTLIIMRTGDVAHVSVAVLDATMIPRCDIVPDAAMALVLSPSQRDGHVIPNFTFTACSNKATMQVGPVAAGP